MNDSLTIDEINRIAASYGVSLSWFGKALLENGADPYQVMLNPAALQPLTLDAVPRVTQYVADLVAHRTKSGRSTPFDHLHMFMDE